MFCSSPAICQPRLTSTDRGNQIKVPETEARRLFLWAEEQGRPLLSKGLSTAILRRQVSAIASILGFPKGGLWPPFEHMSSFPMHLLSLKVVFLVAITSARRVSKLAACSMARNLSTVQDDNITLRTDPTFLPKVNSVFHRSLEVVLPTLCPNSVHPKEHQCHSLDVKRAISF